MARVMEMTERDAVKCIRCRTVKLVPDESAICGCGPDARWVKGVWVQSAFHSRVTVGQTIFHRTGEV